MLLKRLIFFLNLIPLACFSQTDINNINQQEIYKSLSEIRDSIYNGSRLKIDGDTFYLIDSKTTKSVVNDLIDGDKCKEENGLLYEMLQNQEQNTSLKDDEIYELRTALKTTESASEDKEALLKETNKELKKEKAKNKINKALLWGLGITTAIETAIILGTQLSK